MVQLRPYQDEGKQAVYREWSIGNRAVCYVLPTGGGKTVLMANIIHEHVGQTCVIAHRQELVSQISMALAKEGVTHQLLAPRNVIRGVVQSQVRELGASFVKVGSSVTVAGVNTINARADRLIEWGKSVTLWVVDECHHNLINNQWGRSLSLFPNARGLGVTATPERADGKGIGVQSDGLFESLIVGPSMRWLIEQGNLTDYRIFAPPSDLDLTTVDVSSSTGDFVKGQLKTAVDKSHIVGDVVEHYKRIAMGKRGVTFAVDVETATKIAEEYNKAGVPAAVVSAKSKDQFRQDAIRKLQSGEYMQLVNVDLFGEGFDLPAIEVVSMARPTQSYGLFAQQFGRALRPLEGKTHAIIIDHVGNTIRHGLPDRERVWSLDRRERKKRGSKEGEIPLTSCPSCTGVYQRTHVECPYCGHKPEPVGRSLPEHVDGDLCELTPEVLAKMRGEVKRVDDAPLVPQHLEGAAVLAVKKNHHLRQIAQGVLRHAIAMWAGLWKSKGATDRESYRRFYHTFGVDVLTAQTLNQKKAEELTLKINRYLEE
jgi:superfamily II DNA or RNA helicase